MDSKKFREQVGSNLRDARWKHRMRQADLANAVGTGAVSVCKWENGQQMPRLETFYKVTKALGVTMDDILKGVEDE